MAIINPSIPGSAADTASSLNASRGQDADKSSAMLFEGVQDTLKIAAKAVDHDFTERSTREIADRVEANRDKFIDIDSSGGVRITSRSTPPEIDKKTERWLTVREAYQQGKMPESHYWRLMDAEVREVRAKYPGYRDQIDKEVSRILGTTPANALVRELRDEATKGMGNMEKKWEKAYEAAKDHNPQAVASWQAANPGARPSLEALDQMELQGRTRKDIYNQTSQNYTIQEHAEKKDARAANQQVAGLVPSIQADTERDVTNVLKGINPTDKLGTMLSKGYLEPDEIKEAQQINNYMMTNAEKNFNKELDRTMMVDGKQVTVRSRLQPEEISKYRAQVMSRYEQNNIMISGGKDGVNLSDMYKKQNEVLLDRESGALLSDPWMKRVAVANKHIGQVGTGVVLKSYQETQPDMQGLVPRAYGAVLERNSKTLKDTRSEMNAAGVKGDPTIALVATAKALIQDSKTDVQDKAVAVRKMFAPEGRDVLDGQDTRTKLAMIEKMSTPEVAQSIAQLDEKVPGTLGVYKSWVTRHALGLNSVVIDTAKTIQETNNPNVTVKYNQELGQFSYTKNNPQDNSVTTTRDFSVVQQKVEPLNQLLRGMMPVYRATYGAKAGETMIQEIRDTMGVDLSNMMKKKEVSLKDDSRLPK